MDHKDRLRAHTLFTIPVAVIFAVFFFAPLVLGIYYSFTDWNGISQSYSFVGFANFARIFKTAKATSAIWFTIRYAVLLCLGTTLLALVFSLILNRTFRGKTAARAIYFLPAVLGSIVIGLIFSEIYYRVLPPMGEALGIDWLSKSLISSPNTAIFAILIANLWQCIAIPTTIMIAGLQSVPGELHEVAALDGAGAWRRFFTITLPYLAPSLTIVMVLALKDGLMVFDYIMAVTGGGPAGTTNSISTFIYYTAFETYEYSFATAISVLLFVLIAAFGLGQIRLMNKLEAKE